MLLPLCPEFGMNSRLRMGPRTPGIATRMKGIGGRASASTRAVLQPPLLRDGLGQKLLPHRSMHRCYLIASRAPPSNLRLAAGSVRMPNKVIESDRLHTRQFPVLSLDLVEPIGRWVVINNNGGDGFKALQVCLCDSMRSIQHFA